MSGKSLAWPNRGPYYIYVYYWCFHYVCRLRPPFETPCCPILHLFLTELIFRQCHYNDVITTAMASQITNRTIVYTSVYSGADQRKLQSSASLAFVWGIHRRPVNSPHKWSVTRKMFPFDDVIMEGNIVLAFETLLHGSHAEALCLKPHWPGSKVVRSHLEHLW